MKIGRNVQSTPLNLGGNFPSSNTLRGARGGRFKKRKKKKRSLGDLILIPHLLTIMGQLVIIGHA